MLTIGRAYVAKGEHERGLIVFRATADAGFVTEAQVAQVLQGQGRFEASVDFLRKLLLQYPDTASTQSSRVRAQPAGVLGQQARRPVSPTWRNARRPRPSCWAGRSG